MRQGMDPGREVVGGWEAERTVSSGTLVKDHGIKVVLEPRVWGTAIEESGFVVSWILSIKNNNEH